MVINREEKILNQYSSILRCARKLHATSQSEMAENLEISQSKISKLEAGKLMPSAAEIFMFASKTGICVYSFDHGYIENIEWDGLPAGDTLKENNFNVPDVFRTSRSIKVRFLVPFIDLYKEQFSNKKFKEFCKKWKLDSDFFVYYENRLNFSFLSLLLEELLEKTTIKRIVSEVIRREVNKENQLRMLERCLNLKDLSNSLAEFKNFNTLYETNVDLKFTEKSALKASIAVNLKGDLFSLIEANKNWYAIYRGYLECRLQAVFDYYSVKSKNLKVDLSQLLTTGKDSFLLEKAR